MHDLSPEIEERLRAYLDGALPPKAVAEFQRMIENDPRITERLREEEQIDASLKRVFQPPVVDADFLRSLASSEPVTPTQAPPERGRRLLIAALATAASLAIAVVGVQSFLQEPRTEVAFRQRPLVDIYQECVDDEFEPYWVCDNPSLFAASFERRQGVRLMLADLPEDQQMLGISYLAGVSRDSTDMLATVGGKKVIVFIDRLARDWRPATGEFAEAGLEVSRWERFGLVFYQVAPPGTPLLEDAFQLATDDVPRLLDAGVEGDDQE